MRVSIFYRAMLRSETSVLYTISGNLFVRCVSSFWLFILTPFYWPHLSFIFNSCSSSVFLSVLCRIRSARLLPSKIWMFSRLCRTAADQWSFNDEDEMLVGAESGASSFSRSLLAPNTSERSEIIWKEYLCIGGLITAKFHCAYVLKMYCV